MGGNVGKSQRLVATEYHRLLRTHEPASPRTREPADLRSVPRKREIHDLFDQL